MVHLSYTNIKFIYGLHKNIKSIENIYIMKEVVLKNIRQDFLEIVNLYEKIDAEKTVVSEKTMSIKEKYNELVKTNKNKVFLFCLDSLFFQYKVLNMELENYNKLTSLIQNRMYGDYYKLYNIISIQCKENNIEVINPVLENLDTNNVSQTSLTMLSFDNVIEKPENGITEERSDSLPIYKDIDPFFKYKIEDIQTIHARIITFMEELFALHEQKIENIKKNKENNLVGFSILIFLNTLEYEDKLLIGQIKLYLNYIHFYHQTQKKYLKHVLNKIQKYNNDLDVNIMIKSNFILSENVFDKDSGANILRNYEELSLSQKERNEDHLKDTIRGQQLQYFEDDFDENIYSSIKYDICNEKSLYESEFNENDLNNEKFLDSFIKPDKFNYIESKNQSPLTLCFDEVDNICDSKFKTLQKMAIHNLENSSSPSPPINSIKSVAEPEAEPVAEPEAEPVAEPDSEPVAEPDSEPVAEPEAEPVAEPVAEPDSEPVAEPDSEPVAEPDVEPVAEPDVEPVAEPDVEPVAEPVADDSVSSKKNKLSQTLITMNDKIDSDEIHDNDDLPSQAISAVSENSNKNSVSVSVSVSKIPVPVAKVKPNKPAPPPHPHKKTNKPPFNTFVKGKNTTKTN